MHLVNCASEFNSVFFLLARHSVNEFTLCACFVRQFLYAWHCLAPSFNCQLSTVNCQLEKEVGYRKTIPDLLTVVLGAISPAKSSHYRGVRPLR